MANEMFDSIVEQVVNKSFADMLDEERQQKLSDIGKSWDFYYGEQEQYVKQYEGESKKEYDDKDKPVFNYTKLIIDEYVSGVFARPVHVDFAGDEKLNDRWSDITSPLEHNKMLPQMKLVQRISEISETCLVMIRYDEEKGLPYFEEIRGEYLHFLPKENNPREIGTVVVSYVYDTGDPDPEKRFLERIEIVDDQYWEVWVHSPSMKERKLISSIKNPYGFIPGEVFYPDRDDNSFYGISNCKDIVTINETYNNLWAALSRITVHQSFSVLVATSDNEINIEVAPTRYLRLPNSEVAKAQYITPDAKIDEVRKVLISLKEDLQDFSRTPQSVFSSREKQGAPQSGYALKIKRIPIEQVWTDRRQSYGPSYQSLANKTLMVDRIKNGESIDDLIDLKPTVQFSETTPGMSPEEQLIQDQFDLRYNIISPIDILLRRFPEFTREEAKEYILRIREENEELVVGEMLYIGTTGSDEALENLARSDERMRKAKAEAQKATTDVTKELEKV